MFSIAAINDSDSTSKWEPLAPTKEAQEFHLSQIYHEGLVKLQSKDYEKARELLESVLKDPLISDAQVVDNGSDGHLLQLRFLVLKNLATVFLELGSTYYESALRCYLLAVEIDSKDSVAWNHLGTLACSMGQLSISRWAFEQGLICSPTNGNCMEKLLEVLIAIGDEVACISVSELILRRWPSHSRALLVKNTVEDSELIPFAPRGIDKLEAKHPRLKFSEKRKAISQDLTEAGPPKMLKQGIEILLAETSWTSLAGQILDLSKSSASKGPEMEMEMDKYRSRDISISIVLPCTAGSATNVGETERTVLGARDGTISRDDESFEKNDITKEEANIFDEQPQERRSSRLERLRSRKPGKEDSDLAPMKDVAEVIRTLLKPFLINEGKSSCRADSASSFHSAEVVDRSLDSEPTNVIRFVEKNSKNYGAHHLGHLLLEEVSATGVLYEGSLIKLLELEKLTRQWGQARTPECCLFLAELYYDFGICASGNEMSHFLSEAAYHLCKVIEFVALQCSPHCLGMVESSYSGRKSFDTSSPIPIDDSFQLGTNYSFWVRFFWLSARISLVDGDREKAHQELSTSLSLLMNKVHQNDSTTFICLPHCKAMKNLTIERILHEVTLLEISFLLNKTVPKMMEKNMYLECLNLLVPLLLSTEDACHDTVNCSEPEEVFTSIELSALDVLIRASDLMEPMDIGVHLDCHRRKLQILLDAAGLGDYTRPKRRAFKVFSSENELKEDYCMRWNHMVSEEVKEISRSASRIENVMTDEKLNGIVLPAKVVDDIQSLLLVLMCNIANAYFSRKSSGLGIPDLVEQREKCHFIDAAIAFCILQHLKPNVPIKAQTELIVSMHDMLAEFGICYAHGNREREEGEFLKLAIKHLFALDMKLKTKICSLNKGQEETRHVHQSMHEDHDEGPQKIFHDVAENAKFNAGMDHTAQEEASTGEITESDSSEAASTKNCPQVKIIGIECENDTSHNSDAKRHKETVKETPECAESGEEITEDEREELELGIENALDQCFYCLYGLNLRSDSSYEDELSIHKNTSRGDYQTKEQCADVFQYILPYAKASSKTGLIKLRKVLRAIRKHFPQPPDDVLVSNSIDKFLDDPELCEEKLSEGAGSDAFLDLTSENVFAGPGTLAQHQASSAESTEPNLDVYSNLYYLLALSEETRATDKWAGFILTKEGEDFIEQNSKLFKYDLLYNRYHFESWQRLANLYDEEVDLLLNDGSKQINVGAWQKNKTLSQRVEASRRRSRRCLLMTLGLAKTPIQQAEIHELLALVYYDGLQNVVPFYDQRSIVPSKDAVWKMFCENSMRHFKKAFEHKEDWSHVFYIGKLCEKLGYPHEISFSYYAKAIDLNPLAVDPFYRLHASRLKLLCAGGKENPGALKVVASHCLTESTRVSVMSTFAEVPGTPDSSIHAGEVSDGSFTAKIEGSKKLQEIWNILYNDCLSALEICVEGDLKHFHKARYMLARGLYKRGGNGDVEKAKEELSFCFKSSRSSFTINMWEIDSTVKKGRRKTPGVSGNKKALEVNLPESSRKFITCIRKYILFYLKLLEETGDISTLERSYISLRTDKRFSLSLEDIIPVAVGRYLRTLISSIAQCGNGVNAASGSAENLLEKTFSLFLEHINLWSDICSLPEIKIPELTDNLYSCLNQYILLLERDAKVEVLEVINEKVRKRLKNPKLSNSTLAKVYKRVSVAWCRSLVISMALITPLHSRLSTEIQIPGSSGLENAQLLCVDLQADELWSSSSENQGHLKSLESKWNPSLSKIKNVIIKRASDEDVETAAILLRSSFNFYKDSSCALLPSGINLYMVPSQLATETYFQPGIDGVDILDMNTSRKLLLWAYTLLHGYCQSLSAVIKYCEETAKPKTKKGAGTSSTPSNPSASAAVTPISVNAEEVTCRGNETDASPARVMGKISSSEIDTGNKMGSVASNETGQKADFAPVALPLTEGEPNLGCVTQPNSEGMCSESSDALTQDKSTSVTCSSDSKKVSRAPLDLNLPDNSE